MIDARFEDAQEKPVKLVGRASEDLTVIASLVQDAVLTPADVKWMRANRQFAMLINRFRWEDGDAAEREGRGFERVRSVLTIDDVMAVRVAGIDPSDKEQILSLLTIEFEAKAEDDCAGVLRLVFAGDGELEVEVECIEIRLEDVTRPYLANSGHRPSHDQ